MTKVKDVIAQLQQQDPEMDVVVVNYPAMEDSNIGIVVELTKFVRIINYYPRKREYSKPVGKK